MFFFFASKIETINLATFILSSANTVNLVESGIVSFDKELWIAKMVIQDSPKVREFWTNLHMELES